MKNGGGRKGNREGREANTCWGDVKVVAEHRIPFLEYVRGKTKVDEEGGRYEVAGGRKRAVVVGNGKSISPGTQLEIGYLWEHYMSCKIMEIARTTLIFA